MIPGGQIAQLAEIFDRYNNALDPVPDDCLNAKKQLDELVSRLHLTHAPDVDFLNFRYELIHHCREYLRKNRP